MKKSNSFVIMIVFLITLFSCEDFQEQDISNETIHLNSPGNNLETSVTSLTFWWDSIDNVQMYNIQIVKKSFAIVESIILDSTLLKTKITTQIPSGEYEWRVCGISGYNKAYSDTFKLTIQ